MYGGDLPGSNAAKTAMCIHETFSTENGKFTLTWMLNEAGFFKTDRDEIDPSLIAFMSRLLKAGGMEDRLNVKAFAEALLASYVEGK